MKKKLKLYVWREFWPNSSFGLAFAIATNEKEAMAMVEENIGIGRVDLGNWGEVIVHKLDEKIAFAVSGCTRWIG